MKKIFNCLIVLFAIIFLNADEIDMVEPGSLTLKVGTNANYQPFEYVNMGMEIVGFDIDLMKEISKRADFKFKLLEMSFDDLFAALQEGKIDLAISAIGISEERLTTLDFSKPYFNTETLYLKKKIDNRIKSKNDLIGKNVGVQEGTLQENIAKKIDGIVLHSFATDTSLMNGLRTGSLDSIILDSAVGLRILNKYLDLSEFLRESDGTGGFGIAFKKGNYVELLSKINFAIDSIIEDGTYEKLLVKYKLK
ncbi:transporter substrate-binding domain-containing protein [Campylobacter blaseri]|nr:transporter substrate-binding domain-containing protein [Campylobacter blaseri]